jgi:hypothetical protein
VVTATAINLIGNLVNSTIGVTITDLINEIKRTITALDSTVTVNSFNIAAVRDIVTLLVTATDSVLNADNILVKVVVLDTNTVMYLAIAFNMLTVVVTTTDNSCAKALFPDPDIGAEENGCLPNISLPALLLLLGLNQVRLV